MTKMMAHRIFVLGAPRLFVDEQVIELPPAKAVALADGPAPRERLVRLLWAESFEEAARKHIRPRSRLMVGPAA